VTAQQGTKKEPSKAQEKRGAAFLQSLLVPALAVLMGLFIGGIVIAVTDPETSEAFGHFWRAPGAAFAAA